MKLGSSNIADFKLGNNQVDSIYLGVNLVWSSFDSDAKDFIDAAGITGTLQRNTLNQFVKYLKGEGTTNGSNLFSKITALYPYCPIDDSTATATAYSFNLKNPATFQVAWVGFVAGDYLVTGVTGGAGKYGATGVIPNVHLLLNNSGLTAYSRTNIGVTNNIALGSRPSSGHWIFLNTRTASDVIASRINDQTSTTITNTSSAGLIDSQRSASNVRSIYRGGTLLGSDTIASTGRNNQQIFLHGINNNGSLDTPDVSREYAGFAIRESFTDDEIADWYFAWNYYQTNIIPGGRNV
jgi:hypothetical protein